MTQTLEQQRASHAWEKCQGCDDEYAKLAKGLPALIMNSGLMQVMAFLHEKGSKSSQEHCRIMGTHLREWLRQRYPDKIEGDDFSQFMQSMLKSSPTDFREITTEAFAWLRWMRQMAPAVNKGGR